MGIDYLSLGPFPIFFIRYCLMLVQNRIVTAAAEGAEDSAKHYSPILPVETFTPNLTLSGYAWNSLIRVPSLRKILTLDLLLRSGPGPEAK